MADIRQDWNPLDTSVGYALKDAAAALRSAMDHALRPLGVTVPQYACLELLAKRPGLSNAELARGAFVTRQSMNVVLRSLEDVGLIERAETAPTGRALPASLTAEGSARLQDATVAVRSIEDRMLESFGEKERVELRSALNRCSNTLRVP